MGRGFAIAARALLTLPGTAKERFLPEGMGGYGLARFVHEVSCLLNAQRYAAHSSDSPVSEHLGFNRT